MFKFFKRGAVEQAQEAKQRSSNKSTKGKAQTPAQAALSRAASAPQSSLSREPASQEPRIVQPVPVDCPTQDEVELRRQSIDGFKQFAKLNSLSLARADDQFTSEVTRQAWAAWQQAHQQLRENSMFPLLRKVQDLNDMVRHFSEKVTSNPDAEKRVAELSALVTDQTMIIRKLLKGCSSSAELAEETMEYLRRKNLLHETL